jgi:repressor LexA
MGIKENIKRIREIYGLTQQDLADIAGVTNKAVSAWESGLSEPRMGAIERIANRFGLMKSNIIEEGGMDSLRLAKQKDVFAIPLVGTICAGDGLLAEQNIEEYVHYPFPGKRQPDYALRVQGDSMIGAGIEDGDIVYMRYTQWADYNGQIVAVIIKDHEEGMLKRIKWSSDSPFIQLIPENDKYETKEVRPNEIIICGVYMGHFKPERENQ